MCFAFSPFRRHCGVVAAVLSCSPMRLVARWLLHQQKYPSVVTSVCLPSNKMSSTPFYRTQLFIDGEYVDPVKYVNDFNFCVKFSGYKCVLLSDCLIRGGTFTVYNPATNEVIAEVANATAEDVDLAVQAAKRALYSDNWGIKSTGAQRAAILRKLQEIITRRKDDIALLDSLDQGKPLREALADLGDSISACEHFANLAEQQDSHQNEIIENGTGGDFETKILLEPIGVVGAITPWNCKLS
jgi:acyl-CoA reductase-like NAD-dependent aldehyde dehydrogenase